MTAVLGAALGSTLTAMVVLWLLSLPLRNASIVDVFWGPGFALIAWVSLAVAPISTPRAWLVCGCVTVWAARLAIHLFLRNHGRGEDYRYRAMREQHGARFWIVSLGTVFGLQGLLMWVIGWPVQMAASGRGSAGLGWLDAAGSAVWASGFIIEAVADLQLARFTRTAARGAVMDRGLWRYSRHPNYFGDCVLWWGLGLFGLATGAWWTLAGPTLMTVLLLKVSGVTLLESTIVNRRPAYRAYLARTSAFVPWPPRSTPPGDAGIGGESDQSS